MKSAYIARIKASDGTPQSVQEHLEKTSELASTFATKVGMPVFGELMGLLHVDFRTSPTGFLLTQGLTALAAVTQRGWRGR